MMGLCVRGLRLRGIRWSGTAIANGTNNVNQMILFADVHPKDFAIVVVEASINAGLQNASVHQRISVRGRGVKIVHLKLFSVHGDDVSSGVARRWLFMQNLDLSFGDLILSVSICSD